MLQRLFAARWLAAALLCAGCSGPVIQLYEGSPRRDSDIAVIVAPEEIEIASVNGVAVEGASGMHTRGEKTLQLAPGRYELLAFYRELWQLGDQHDVLRSDPAMFVVDARAGGRYRLDFSRPQDYEEARRLAERFTGWVEDIANGERTPSQDSGVGFRKGLLAAMTFDDTLVPVARRDARGQTVVPMAPAEPVAGDGATAVREWLPLMKAWWTEASAEERREFLHWLAEQP